MRFRTAQFAARVVCLQALFLLSASGCGDSEEDSTGDAPAGGETSLTVTLDPDGQDGRKAEMTEDVSCGAEADDTVCLAVSEIDPDDLDPVSPDTACTELFGGPDTATLEGTIGGESLDVELTRINGCEIERFDAAVPLLQALFPKYEPGASLAP